MPRADHCPMSILRLPSPCSGTIELLHMGVLKLGDPQNGLRLWLPSICLRPFFFNCPLLVSIAWNLSLLEIYFFSKGLKQMEVFPLPNKAADGVNAERLMP